METAGIETIANEILQKWFGANSISEKRIDHRVFDGHHGPYMKEEDEEVDNTYLNWNGTSASDDPLYEIAKAYVKETGTVTVTLLQRYFSIPYFRASHLVEAMAEEGVIYVSMEARRADA